jgi:hypothetical protein
MEEPFARWTFALVASIGGSLREVGEISVFSRERDAETCARLALRLGLTRFEEQPGGAAWLW